MKNICSKSVLQKRKGKNSLSLLLCAAAFAIFVGTLPGCGVKKEGIDESKNANEPAADNAENTPRDVPGNAELMVDAEAGQRHIQSFTAKEAEIVPKIKLYDFKSAKEIGDVQQIRGMLPGADEGIWYIVSIDGVEYFYGAYGLEDAQDAEYFGYAVFSERHALHNGICVGMTMQEVLEQYPDMAVVDFEGNMLSQGITGTQGWNGTAYPRSYLDMDAQHPYDGKDYKWTDQFDCAMLADAAMGTADEPPACAALLIKDGRVYAITFFYPAAG